MLICVELIVIGCDGDGIVCEIGVDVLVYQDFDVLKYLVIKLCVDLIVFDVFCFDGCYIIGDIDKYYFDVVEGKCGGKFIKSNEDDGDGNVVQQFVL